MNNQNIEISPLAALRKRVYDSRKNNVSYKTICKLENIDDKTAKMLATTHSKYLSNQRNNIKAVKKGAISSLRANIVFDINGGAKVADTAAKYGLTFDKCEEHYLIENQRIVKASHKIAAVRQRLTSWNELTAIIRIETAKYKNPSQAMAAKSNFLMAETMPIVKRLRSQI